MEFTISIQDIITFAAVLSALGIIFGFIFKGYKRYLKQEEHEKRLDEIEDENALVCFALSACLDGLLQLGCNHTVPIAKEKLDKFLNKKAHHIDKED